MKYKEYTWDKEFEIKGRFSNDSAKVVTDDCNYGVLKYSHDNIILEVFDVFPNEDADDLLFGFGSHVDKIYGFDSSGKLLILEAYGDPFGNSNVPGFPIIKYHIKNFKIFDINYLWTKYSDLEFSKHFEKLVEELEETQIQYLQFSFNHIEEWVGKSLVSMTRDKNHSKVNINIDTSKYSSTKIVIESENILFEDCAGYSVSYDKMTFDSIYNIKLSSVSGGKISLGEAYNTARRIKELIEFLSEKALSFVSFNFLCEKRQDNNWPVIKGKYFAQHSRKEVKWEKYRLYQISLKNLHSEFNNVLNKWFDEGEQLEFIVRQFTKNLHGDIYLEDKLLDAIRNLEVYARNFRVKRVVEISEEEKVEKQKIMTFIDKNIHPDFQKRFRKRIKYTRQDSDLRDKLEDLFRNIPNNLSERLFQSNSIEEVVDKLYQTRNYYTHGDKKDKYKKLVNDFNEMYELQKLCQEVLRYYIFKELSLDYIIVR